MNTFTFSPGDHNNNIKLKRCSSQTLRLFNYIKNFFNSTILLNQKNDEPME